MQTEGRQGRGTATERAVAEAFANRERGKGEGTARLEAMQTRRGRHGDNREPPDIEPKPFFELY